MSSSNKRGGGQPLSYTNPNVYEPAALPGAPLLYSQGTVARPEISQKGGQPLSYTNPGIYEPAALPGAPLLYASGTTARPELGQKGGQPLTYTNPNILEPAGLSGTPLLYAAGTTARNEIPQKGGFPPSVMTNLVGNAQYLAPLAATAAYRLLDNSTRKTRRHKGGAEDWELYRQRAKQNLERIAPGRADSKWIMKLASTRRKKLNNKPLLEMFSREKIKDPKRVKPAPIVVEENDRTPIFMNPAAKWKYNREKAKENLKKIHPQPSGKNIIDFAKLKRTGNDEAIQAYLKSFKERMGQKQKEKEQVAAIKKRIVQEKEAREVVSKVTGRVVQPTRAIKEQKELKQQLNAMTPKKVKYTGDYNTREWGVIMKEAGEELKRYGKTRRGNIPTYAKYKKMKDTQKMKEFLDAFQARDQPIAAPAPKKNIPAQAEPPVRPPNLTLKNPRRVKTIEQEDWEKYREAASKLLKAISPTGATAAEISEVAKAIRAEQNVRPLLDDFQIRVEKTARRLARQQESKEEEESKEEPEVNARTAEPLDFNRSRNVFPLGNYNNLLSNQTTPDREPPSGWPNTPPGRTRVKFDNTPMPETPPARRAEPKKPYYPPAFLRENEERAEAPAPRAFPEVKRQYGKLRAPRMEERKFDELFQQLDALLKK
jgi:hypothetical protein